MVSFPKVNSSSLPVIVENGVKSLFIKHELFLLADVYFSDNLRPFVMTVWPDIYGWARHMLQYIKHIKQNKSILLFALLHTTQYQHTSLFKKINKSKLRAKGKCHTNIVFITDLKWIKKTIS